jgi:UDP-N-acetyl-D-mannosaminuronic acid dehydrogenase
MSSISCQSHSVCVIGLGYIGLPTASFLATKGYDVLGVDIAPEVVARIGRAEIHIEEPDLDILVKSAVQSGRLKTATEPAPADIFIIAVPTPMDADKRADLDAVEAAVRAIAPHVRPGNLVILESTSPVGATERLVAGGLEAQGVAVDKVLVAHCPERVLPGRILIELVQNDRVVGGLNEASTAAAAEFYREFVRGEVIETTAAVAEMTKLAENTFRDVNIALANELSMICDRLGIDVFELIRLANHHPRVRILQPGPGVGGHCIAVDPWFVVQSAPEEARLIRTAREVNDSKPEWVLAKVREKAARFKRPAIACLGLAFKADVDDLRESPALHIVRRLRDADVGQLLVCEPNLERCEEFPLVGVREAVRAADIVLLLVDHREFRAIKPAQLQEKVLIDTRGALR